MKRIISALALLTAAVVGIAGCGGDDDDDTTPTAGKGSTGGEPSTTGGQPAATGATGGDPAATGATGGGPAAAGGEPAAAGGAASGNVMCDPAQDGVCQNPMDCPFVIDGTARIEAGSCGQESVTSGGDENDTRDCILKKLDMSSDCAACYAATVTCTIKNCIAKCFNDPEATVCKECQVEKGCRAAFDECSGLPE